MQGDEIVIVSDLVEGVPLHDHVLGNVRLPLLEATGILKQVASGLAGALARGVVHGNLKAHNVLVTELREVRLTDFGQGQGDAGTMTHYVAPERARQGATPPGDLYACGVLWYFMLAGVPPFAGVSPEEVRAARAASRAIPLSRRVAGLPAGADALFTRLTQREPARRTPGTAALMADLDLLENGELERS